MDAVTVHSDLEPKKIICLCFHYFSFHLPLKWWDWCYDLNFLNTEFQANFPSWLPLNGRWMWQWALWDLAKNMKNTSRLGPWQIGITISTHHCLNQDKKKINCSLVLATIFFGVLCNFKMYSQFWKSLETQRAQIMNSGQMRLLKWAPSYLKRFNYNGNEPLDFYSFNPFPTHFWNIKKYFQNVRLKI